MKIYIDGEDLGKLNDKIASDLAAFKNIGPLEEAAININQMALTIDSERRHVLIPAWWGLDIVIEKIGTHLSVSLFWGDILVRYIEPYNTRTIECYFEENIALNNKLIDELLVSSLYYISRRPEELCVPVRIEF